MSSNIITNVWRPLTRNAEVLETFREKQRQQEEKREEEGGGGGGWRKKILYAATCGEKIDYPPATPNFIISTLLLSGALGYTEPVGLKPR